MKEAGVTAIAVGEWDGQKGKYVVSLGLHRLVDSQPGNLWKAPAQSAKLSVSKTLFKFASGTLGVLSGKTVNFSTKPTRAGRFEIEFSD